MQTPLPTPGKTEIERSQKLTNLIYRAIAEQKNAISFSKYVDYCLYTPKLGYYESDTPIFGREGDFVTAPELSPHFAKALANQYVKLVQHGVIENNLLELGAGSGILCAQLLEVLHQMDALPNQYLIAEHSRALQQRQNRNLKELPEQLRQRIKWIDLAQLEQFDGFIVANEVFDALPFLLLEREDNHLYEICVGTNNAGQLVLKRRSAEKAICAEIENILPAVMGVYRSELNCAMQTLMKAVSSGCGRAVFCVIDYGFTQNEYYHPDRSMGTMICCYQNHVHEDPLWWPGLQDISCSVDFSRLTQYASSGGWQPLAYSPQAHFLLANEVLKFANKESVSDPLSAESQNLKKLLMPSEMGERFQVLVLAKNVTLPASFFTLRDYRFKL